MRASPNEPAVDAGHTPARVLNMLEQLDRTFTPEASGRWLFGGKEEFGGDSPLQLLQRGQFSAVQTALDRLT